MPILASEDMCTGCMACRNKCAFEAISVKESVHGEELPIVDGMVCRECGACEDVCPINHPLHLNAPLKGLAAWSTIPSEVERSASGGIGAAIASSVIRNGGSAFGAAFTEDGRVRHIRASSLVEAEGLRKSKYVQSSIGLIFREVKALLEQGDAPVVFFGTPCQLAGLKLYLGKCYEQLLLVDLICHGVPPYRYLQEHVDALGVLGEFESVTFRDSKGSVCFKVRTSSGVLGNSKWVDDAYMFAFMKSVSYRESCYSCPYAGRSRVGDITIGDYWGLDKSTLGKEYTGKVSAVLINTEKGDRQLAKMLNEVWVEVRDIDEIVAGNPQLNHPAKRHCQRDAFLEQIENNSFDSAVKRSPIGKEFLTARIKESPWWLLLRKAKKRLHGKDA